MDKLIRLSRWVGQTFAVWVVVFGLIGFLHPPALTWAMKDLEFILGLIMFGMGLTLTPADFKILSQHPRAVLIGVVLQFLIMPSTAWLLAKGLGLPDDVAVGVILVGACPGGTASNVISYLARGNVALSVAVTAISTLLAPLLTPAIFYLFASQWLNIDAGAMFWGICRIVLLPILAGLLVHRYWRRPAESLSPILPLLSVLGIGIVIGAVLGSAKAKLLDTGALIFAVVMLHNGLGLLLGFLGARWLRLPFDAQKTLAIEVGMQNSALAATLAKASMFAALPLVAVPAAFFGLWHNFSGALLASYWARKADREEADRSASP